MFNKLDSLNSKFVATCARKLQNRTSANSSHHYEYFLLDSQTCFAILLDPQTCFASMRSSQRERPVDWCNHISLSLFHFMRRLLIEEYTWELCLENVFSVRGGGGGWFFVWSAKSSPLGRRRKLNGLLAKWKPLLRERAKTQERIAKGKEQRLRTSNLKICGTRAWHSPFQPY